MPQDVDLMDLLCAYCSAGGVQHVVWPMPKRAANIQDDPFEQR